MSLAVDYPTASQARAHLKDVLDSVEHGRTVTLRRDNLVTAVVSADRLRNDLFRTTVPGVSLLKENGRIVALMENRPFVSEGATVDDALDDLALTLREYAEDWEERLQYAPNHALNGPLVMLVKLSTDEQLTDWFNRGGQ